MLFTALFAAASIAQAPAAQETLAACPFREDRWTSMSSKAELPPGALESFGEMADVSEPFQVGDMVQPGLLMSRFISASGRACNLLVVYEQGGRGYGFRLVWIRFVHGGWFATPSKASGH